MTADPLPAARRTCLVCGEQGYDVLPARMSRLREPGPGGPFTAMTRCRWSGQCRARCERNGDPWPLDDGSAPLRSAAP